ncbi:MAG TPA: LamG domain-containing protein, partial [Terriglobales bacterium]|nr:LamG domain-containing protein [Terriglobales bacterium]
MQGRSQHWLDAQSRPAVPAFVASILTVIALLCGSAFAQQAAPIPNGLTHWWRAENNGADTQGGLGTVLGNGATFTANGKVGAAFFFPGTTANNVSFGNQLGNFGTADFTVDFWMQTTNTGSQALLSKRAICNPDSFFDIRTNRGGAVNLEVELDQDSANTNYNLLRIPVDVSDGVFHHIAVTRQGVTVSVYLDGALIGQQQTAGITNISNAALFTLGQSACSGSPDGTAWFDGTLDELHIFNRALSQNEVQSIYNAGSAGLTTLVGWWKFNEGTGAATADSSGNGNTGVLSGSPLPTWSSAGPTGAIYFPASLSFDGVSSYVDIPNAAVSSSLNFASQLTVAAWVKPAIPFQQGAYGIISRPNGSAATGWAL